MDIPVCLPSGAITINSLTTIAPWTQLSSQAFAQSVPTPLSLSVCVCSFKWEKEGGKEACEAVTFFFYAVQVILLKIIHPCFQGGTDWIVSLAAFSETNSKLIFKRRHVCLWPTVVDFIYTMFTWEIPRGGSCN